MSVQGSHLAAATGSRPIRLPLHRRASYCQPLMLLLLLWRLRLRLLPWG